MLQSAGLGSAEMTSVGQSAPGAHTPWIRCSAYDEAQHYSYYRKVKAGHFQVMSGEYFDREEKAQHYLRLRRDPSLRVMCLPPPTAHRAHRTAQPARDPHADTPQPRAHDPKRDPYCSRGNPQASNRKAWRPLFHK